MSGGLVGLVGLVELVDWWTWWTGGRVRGRRRADERRRGTFHPPRICTGHGAWVDVPMYVV